MLQVAVCLPVVALVACTVGEFSPFDDGVGGEHGQIDDPNNTGGGGDATAISMNTTWSGAVTVETTTTVNAGVTLTVAAGTTISLKPNVGLKLEGVMDVQGTSGSKVTIKSTDPTLPHTGISVTATGELKLHYVEQSGGGIYTTTGGKATIYDSLLSNPGGGSSRGDFLVMNGGILDMQYSVIGLETGDGTHCQLHFQSMGNTIKITNSTIRGVPYGLMLYGGTGANLTNNNWDNTTDIATQPEVSADISGSYFKNGAPTAGPGAQLTGTVATVPVANAQPRP